MITTKTTDFKIICWCIAISLCIFAIDSALPLGVAGGVPYILVILISLWSTEKKTVVAFGILASILTIAGLFSSPSGGEVWKVIVNRFLALFAIWITVSLGLLRKKAQDQREDAIQEREKAQSELKILKGLLPICASCKNIRDKDGNWLQIESYIRDHSEADFSHSVCPDCARKLYPDIAARIKLE